MRGRDFIAIVNHHIHSSFQFVFAKHGQWNLILLLGNAVMVSKFQSPLAKIPKYQTDQFTVPIEPLGIIRGLLRPVLTGTKVQSRNTIQHKPNGLRSYRYLYVCSTETFEASVPRVWPRG